MQKIMIFHYATAFALIAFAVSEKYNIVPMMILFGLIYVACTVWFAKSAVERDRKEIAYRKRRCEFSKEQKKRFDDIENALRNKMDKPKNKVRTGSRVSPAYIKMLEHKGVEVVDDRTEDQKAP